MCDGLFALLNSQSNFQSCFASISTTNTSWRTTASTCTTTAWNWSKTTPCARYRAASVDTSSVATVASRFRFSLTTTTTSRRWWSRSTTGEREQAGTNKASSATTATPTGPQTDPLATRSTAQSTAPKSTPAWRNQLKMSTQMMYVYTGNAEFACLFKIKKLT